jgi:hypothetical protein
LYMPYREVRALLAERTRQSVGTARPRIELWGIAILPHLPRAKYQAPTRFEEQVANLRHVRSGPELCKG